MAVTELSLRQWEPADLSLLKRTLGDPEMTKYLGGPEPEEKLKSRHEKYLALRESGTAEMFVITMGKEQTPVGTHGYWERDEGEDKGWETGWSVLPEYQGHGIATQATLLLIEHLRKLGTHRYLYAYPTIENAASNAICRKAGFTLRGQSSYEYPPGHPVVCNDWLLDLNEAKSQ